jgi:DNA-binding transcriptional ArsR family regulator
MDDAPMLLTEKGKPDTTARHVLGVLAERARPDGSQARPSLLDIQYRTGYDRRTVQRALRRLEAAGLIAAEGVKNGCTVYRLALKTIRPASDRELLKAEEEADRKAVAERVRRHRAKDVTHLNDVTETDSDDVTEPDVTHSDDVTNGDVTHSASVCNALKVRSVTHSTPPEPTTYEPTTEPTTTAAPLALFDQPAPPVAAPVAAAAPSTPVAIDFETFYALYPRKEKAPVAKRAWTKALKAGVDPEAIIAALHAHCDKWKREQTARKYIPLPATWLNAESYNDDLGDEPAFPSPNPNIPTMPAWTSEDYHRGFHPPA